MIGLCDVCGIGRVRKPEQTAATRQPLVVCNRCLSEWAVPKQQPDKSVAAKAAETERA